MSTDRDVTRIVQSWLEDGVTALPDRVLDNVLAQIPATRQRRAWWPAWRLPHMNTPTRIAVAAVAVVVLALAVITFGPKIGGVGSAPPTPAPTLPPSGQLAPGRYRSDFMTYTLPAGWSSYGGFAALTNDANPPNGMGVVPQRNIATVYNDPCRWQTTGAQVGSTVDELVAALVAQKRGATVTPVPVTVDSFTGQQIDLMVPLDITVTDCDGGQYKSWSDNSGGDRYNQGPGQHDLLDILDVGGQTLAIQRSFYPANTAADLAELQAIVDSITIDPTAQTLTATSAPGTR